jgi:ADP-ribosylglycohydrolase
MALPPDYPERVYAGVLGKIIGVYLGRPFEGWTCERILAELGPITGYVNERLGLPLVVADDDLSGTFAFVRAVADHGCRRDLTPAQIGQTWLNYIIENRTVLWWGGLGNSTEHTAYLRLKQGIPAPASGSAALNGIVIAEQIGAQIFIDSWAMLAPGDPELAADLARRAASVSHDGEAIFAAQALAGMQAQAFVESSLPALLDTARRLIPPDSTIARLIDEMRELRAGQSDWRAARALLMERYHYSRYQGNCHIVPNHALVLLGLLYGDDDFQQSLMITNTAGWDTDCNSGNLGCLLGIKNGLDGIDSGSVDWRGPVADRLYVSTADGGRSITDAVTEAYNLVNTARALDGQPPLAPKGGARFHFELPGSVQGFRSLPGPGRLRLANAAGNSARGRRSLAFDYEVAAGQSAYAATPTFIPPEALNAPGYGLQASPTLYPGQVVRAGLMAAHDNAAPVNVRLFLRHFDPADALVALDGSAATLLPGARAELEWRVPDLGGAPCAEIGVAVEAPRPTAGLLHLDYLTWDGAPRMTLDHLAGSGTAWRRAWVDAADSFDQGWHGPFRLIQNRGTGMVLQGTPTWRNYRVSTTLRPHLAEAAGLGICARGLRRYFGLWLVRGGLLRLVETYDDEESVLAVTSHDWRFEASYALSLEASDGCLRAWIDGAPAFDVQVAHPACLAGAVALLCREGCASFGPVHIQPGDTA